MADPFEALLRPVAGILNRNIAESTPARELSAKLAGRNVSVRLPETGLAMVFRFESDGVALTSELDGEPDVVITGTPLSLLRLAASDDEGISSLEGVDLSGDARVARAFQDLLAHSKPDLEDELSRVVGDTAAHGMGKAARAFGAWVREARSTLHANIREYLQEERQSVPSRYEVERFTRHVDTLRDDVDRLEARIRKLEAEC